MPFPIVALLAAAKKIQGDAAAGKQKRAAEMAGWPQIGLGGGDMGAGSPNDLTAMLQQQAESNVVGSYAGGFGGGNDPLALKQRRAMELMRRRKVLLNGVGTGLQGTTPAPNRGAITIGGQPQSNRPVFGPVGDQPPPQSGGGFAQSQTSPYSSVYGYNPNTTFKF